MNYERIIKSLFDYRANQYYITSLYIKLGPEERENFKYKIILKNLLKRIKQNLLERSFSKESLEYVDLDLKKIENFFEDTNNLRSCNGIAVFASNQNNFWEVFKLPFVFRNRLIVDKLPLFGELVKINEDTENVPFILVDKKKARFFNVGFDKVKELQGYIYPAASRTTRFQSPEGKFKQTVSATSGGGQVSQGYGEYGFNRAIKNDYHQHLKYVSDRIFDYYKENKFNSIIIGGNEQTLSDFKQHLHSYLNERLLGEVILDIENIKSDQLIDETLMLKEKRKYYEHQSILDEFEEKISQRLSISGLKPTLEALMRGQVKTLLIIEGYSHEGFICPETGLLTLSSDEHICSENEVPVPVIDVVDHAMEEAFKQGAYIQVLRSDSTNKIINGIGAILRFSL